MSHRLCGTHFKINKGIYKWRKTFALLWGKLAIFYFAFLLIFFRIYQALFRIQTRLNPFSKKYYDFTYVFINICKNNYNKPQIIWYVIIKIIVKSLTTSSSSWTSYWQRSWLEFKTLWFVHTFLKISNYLHVIKKNINVYFLCLFIV